MSFSHMSINYYSPLGGDFCNLSRKAILLLRISSGSSDLPWPDAATEAIGLAAA